MNELVKLKDSPILSADKAGMIAMVDTYLEDLAINGGEPLKDLALCRKYIFILEELEKGLRGYAMNELRNCDREENELLGATLKIVESAPKFDFSSTDSWSEQKKKVDAESKKLKDVEAFIKTLKSKTTIVDEETGETHEFFPAAKSSSTTIRVTLK